MDETGGRREFFRSVARNVCLGGAALLGALLAGKRIRSRREKCISRGVCRGCEVFDGCGLPQALSARRSMGE